MIVLPVLFVSAASLGAPLPTSAVTEPESLPDVDAITCKLEVDAFAQRQEQEKQAEAKRTQLLKEIEALGEHEWAGEYTCGDGLGMNIRFTIAPKGGFVYTWRGCMGLYDVNQGAFSAVKDDRFVLDAILPLPGDMEYLERELMRVRWGEQHYLIPPGRMMQFCNQVNRGDFSDQQFARMFPLRSSEVGKPTPGLPEIPPEFKKYLKDKPLTARVTAIEEPTYEDTGVENVRVMHARATVDVGTDSGLHKGMTLLPRQPGGMAAYTVERVWANGAEIAVSEYIAGAGDRAPQIGWVFSTRSAMADQPRD